MNRSICARLLLGFAVLSIGCEPREQATQDGSKRMPSKNSPREAKSEISWDSPKMLAIEKEWKSLDTARGPHREGDRAMDKISKIMEARANVLRKRLSAEDMCQLAAMCGTLPLNAPKESAFIYAVVAHMIDVFVDLGDRVNLVRLLSTHFVQRIGLQWYIEECLVGGKLLKDPILILGEAYTKCEVPEVRDEIAAAVRRAFAGSGIVGKDDADFVNNSMRWYEQNKDQLMVNPYYAIKSSSIDPAVAKYPLFVKKSLPHEAKSENLSWNSPRILAIKKEWRKALLTNSIRTLEVRDG